MTVYLFPNLKSKKAFQTALKNGDFISAVKKTPWGDERVVNEEVAFSGPHFPEPHRFYGNATVVNGKVTKIK